MEFRSKIGLLSLFFFFFFCKVILRWKWKLRNNRGVLEDLKGNRREKQAKEKKEKRKKKRKEKKKEEKQHQKTKQNKKKKKRKKKNKFFFPNWKKEIIKIYENESWGVMGE